MWGYICTLCRQTSRLWLCLSVLIDIWRPKSCRNPLWKILDSGIMLYLTWLSQKCRKQVFKLTRWSQFRSQMKWTGRLADVFVFQLTPSYRVLTSLWQKPGVSQKKCPCLFKNDKKDRKFTVFKVKLMDSSSDNLDINALVIKFGKQKQNPSISSIL